MAVTNFAELVTALDLGYLVSASQAIVISLGFLAGVLIGNCFSFWKW